MAPNACAAILTGGRSDGFRIRTRGCIQTSPYAHLADHPPMSVPPSNIQPDREVIAGVVERVTFHNAESGFYVLRVKARAHRDLG